MIKLKTLKKYFFLFKKLIFLNEDKILFNYIIIFFILTFSSGILDFWLLRNLPNLVNTIERNDLNTRNIIFFILLAIISFITRLINLKHLTRTASKISETPNKINLIFLKYASSQDIGAISPDVIRRQIVNNSYDFLRYIIVPLLTSFNSLVSSLFIFSAAFLVSPRLFTIFAISAILLLSCLYKISSKKYNKISSRLNSELSEYDDHVNEISENIKELYIYDFYEEIFKLTNKLRNKLFTTFSNSVFFSRLPKNIIDSSLMIIMGLIILITTIFNGLLYFEEFTGIFLSLGIASARGITFISQFLNGFIVISTYKNYFTSGITFNNSLNRRNKFTFTKVLEKEKNYYREDYYNLKQKFQELKIINFVSPLIKKSIDKQINFSSKKGKLTVIKGPSGSGKSSLLESICKFKDNESGEIILLNSKNEKCKIRKNFIAYVPQTPIIFNESISYNITLKEESLQNREALIKCAINAGCFDSRILENSKNKNNLLIKEEVKKFLNKNVGRNGKFLSGGERKRIGLARAFYSSRNIILLDEPTAGLDVKLEEYIIDEIKKKSKNVIIILTTHSNKLDNCIDDIMHL